MPPSPQHDLPDPRHWPAHAAAASVQALHEQVERRLADPSAASGDALDAALVDVLRGWLLDGKGADLEQAIAHAPSPALARHVLRLLPLAEAGALASPALRVLLFAVPLVVVAAGEGTGSGVSIRATLDDAPAIGATLREQGLLGGTVEFALADALVPARALAYAALPALVAHGRAMLEGAAAPLDIAPAAIAVVDAQERAHLRFLLGTAVTGPRGDPLAEHAAGAWMMTASRLLSARLATPDATVLVLPRPPQRLSAALPAGFAAQREVALQLFAAAGLRELRSRYGEPVAVISAHESPGSAGGGELRLSLSSPFGPHAAEGFRYPLAPYERTADAVAAIAGLLADCRVADVRLEPAIQADRDAATGLTRFCRPDDPAAALH